MPSRYSWGSLRATPRDMSAGQMVQSWLSRGGQGVLEGVFGGYSCLAAEVLGATGPVAHEPPSSSVLVFSHLRHLSAIQTALLLAPAANIPASTSHPTLTSGVRGYSPIQLSSPTPGYWGPHLSWTVGDMDREAAGRLFRPSPQHSQPGHSKVSRSA